MIERFPDAPARIRALPVNDKGFPIPYFAEEIDGVRDIRVVSPATVAKCVRLGLCWICGGRLGTFKAFTIGPMCAVNRVNSEPPSHRECAEFAAVACPFLSRPMARRSSDLPEGNRPAPGIALERNPGAVAVWITRSFRPFKTGTDGGGRPGTLFSLGEPLEILWFAEGRRARRAEVERSVEGGLPALYAVADQQAGGRAELDKMVAAFRARLARDFRGDELEGTT
jgi:hypothetical protein